MRKNHHGLLLQEDGSWLLWLGEHLFSPSQFTSAARLLATSEGLLSRFYGDFPEQMSQVASTAGPHALCGDSARASTGENRPLPVRALPAFCPPEVGSARSPTRLGEAVEVGRAARCSTHWLPVL